MRNIVAHDYGNIDEEIVWNTIINDIPELMRTCESIIESSLKENY